MIKELPLPPHFDPEKVDKVWRVQYQQIAEAAMRWAAEYRLQPAANDTCKICLLAVDVQNTFCLPDFELFVGGRSGSGAVDDNRRLCQFIYRNLHRLTLIIPTLDSHQAMQIFHSIFLVNDQGEQPAPYTLISADDMAQGHWHFNPAIADSLGITPEYGDRYLQHYTRKLAASGKYDLTIWPYHAIVGGIGHALVPAFEEAVFFHTISRNSQPGFYIKGDHPLTEHYSVLGPEVTSGMEGKPLVAKDEKIANLLQQYDVLLIAGQAKSHCVAWTIDDLLATVVQRNPSLAAKIYLLEDCTSPVVIPGKIDYTEQADAAFQRFAAAGMHIVRSTEPLADWLVVNQ